MRALSTTTVQVQRCQGQRLILGRDVSHSMDSFAGFEPQILTSVPHTPLCRTNLFDDVSYIPFAALQKALTQVLPPSVNVLRAFLHD